LGIWNVDDMLSRMSSHLFTEWIAYHNLEPFGDELIDIHFAELKAHVINSNRKRSQQVDPKKLRLWKALENFNPQEYFDQLKEALLFKKWNDPNGKE
jgi:hypothetical protein